MPETFNLKGYEVSDSLNHRRLYFGEWMLRGEEGMTGPQGAGVMVSCPCCGYPTLTERGGDEICELCNWEDDGQDDESADVVRGGANKSYSLTQARANFERYLMMYGPDDGVRSNSPVEEAAKRAIVDAFDRMVDEHRHSVPRELLQQVIDNEAVLRNELRARIREYEEAHRAPHAADGS